MEDFNKEDYIISIATVPFRFNDTLPRVLESIKDLGFTIVVNIPKEYRKDWDVIEEELPKSSQNVIINRTREDWGPATKLLGGIEWARKNRNNIKGIITVDDDIIFKDPEYAITSLISESTVMPGCVITRCAIKTVNPPYKCGDGLKHMVTNDYIDGVAGYLGVFYPFNIFDNDVSFNFLREIPEGFYSEDDAYFGALASKLGCPAWATSKHSSAQILGSVSAVEVGLTNGYDRIQRESELYTYLVNSKYLPNKNIKE